MPDSPSPSPTDFYARAWVEHADSIDRQLSPLGLRAMDRLALAAGGKVLDVGCGAGQTLLQIVERVGPSGQVIGVDVAPLLLAAAARRTADLPQVRRIEADAETVALRDASVDAVFSRFGVMRFADPLKAFANFRRILRPGGALAFVCWRAFADNPLDRVPLEAAGFSAPVDASPFSFADPAEIRRALQAAGFVSIAIEAHDEAVPCGGVDDATRTLISVGPLGALLRADPALRTAAEACVRRILAAYLVDGDVRLNAAVWIVSAKVPGAP